MITSDFEIARTLPNIYDVTSVFSPDVRDVTIIPMARELLLIKAIAASPFMPLKELTRKSKKAATTQTGMETARGAQLKAKAMAIVPNPTWESPSPIIEKRFNTRLTPKRAEQRAIKLPATRERVINPYENKSLKKSNITFPQKLLNMTCVATGSTVMIQVGFANFNICHIAVIFSFFIIFGSSKKQRLFIHV